MRYHQHRAGEIRQGSFDRQRRRQIQVVGRFVQQQQLRRLSPPQRAGQRRLEPFAAAQRAQRQRDAIRAKLQLRQPVRNAPSASGESCSPRWSITDRLGSSCDRV